MEKKVVLQLSIETLSYHVSTNAGMSVTILLGQLNVWLGSWELYTDALLCICGSLEEGQKQLWGGTENEFCKIHGGQFEWQMTTENAGLSINSPQHHTVGTLYVRIVLTCNI